MVRPPQRPDLNITESLWDYMKRQKLIRRRTVVTLKNCEQVDPKEPLLLFEKQAYSHKLLISCSVKLINTFKLLALVFQISYNFPPALYISNM